MATQFDGTEPLERYGHNLTRLAKRGAFSPLAGSEAMVERALHILQRRNKNVPVILDSDEARRRAIVMEIVRRMANGEAPEPLLSGQVVELDYEALFSQLSDDTMVRRARRERQLAPLFEELAQAEPDTEEGWELLGKLFRWPSLEEWIAPTMVLERLQSLFVAMHRAAVLSLLYADHFHRLVGGELERYPMNATTLLKPALARGQIQLIGTCTLEQYRQYIERDASIQRRCQEICVPEDACRNFR